MKIYPPPVHNNLVSKHRMEWLEVQPITSTIPMPNGVKVPKDLSIDEIFNLIKEWQKSDDSLKINTTSNSFQDYHIEDSSRRIMLHELMQILSYNDFSSELLSDDKLKISKGFWSMDIDSILEKMPFADYLPHQIAKCYEHESHNKSH